MTSLPSSNDGHTTAIHTDTVECRPGWMEYVGGAAYKVLVHADPPRSDDMEEDVR